MLEIIIDPLVTLLGVKMTFFLNALLVISALGFLATAAMYFLCVIFYVIDRKTGKPYKMTRWGHFTILVALLWAMVTLLRLVKL